MQCIVVDYGSGNVRSVLRALQHVATRHTVRLSDDPKVIADADYLVLPGVGAFRHCADSLAARTGIPEAIHQHAQEQQRPFLGICVGMQLLASYGEEYEKYTGLDWIAGCVQPFDAAATEGLAIPHMGWSSLIPTGTHPLLADIAPSSMMYFVHSYVFRPENPEHILAYTEYGERYCALVGCENIIGTQFHPEKSQKTGLRFLHNFLHWTL